MREAGVSRSQATWSISELVWRRVGPLSRHLLGRKWLQTRSKDLSEAQWLKTYDVITPELRHALIADVATWPSHPLISVIMPSYNIEPKWLSQAIESVRNQIYPHWELCISDDASTIAEIRPLLEGYAATDSRIHVKFRSENGHISVNSNSALELASGDYVALMDADDLLSEDALFWVGREIAMHPEVDLLFSDEDKVARRQIPMRGRRPTGLLKRYGSCALGCRLE